MFQSVSNTASLRRVSIPAALLTLLAACSSDNGSSSVPLAMLEDETTPNNTPASANIVPVGTPVRGDLDLVGDVDVFAVSLTGGYTVKIELFGTRSDQGLWDENDNIPRLALLDTDANENATLLEHTAYSDVTDPWYWGRHDLDIPMFLVPVTGTYYLRLSQDNPALGGGAYVLRASYISVAGLQREAEPIGETGVNDTAETAQLIVPGTMHGYHYPGEYDYYKFTVGAHTIVRFEMTAYRNGIYHDSGAYYDTELQLFAADGTTLLAANDDSIFYDSAIDFRIDEAGTYFVRVDEFDTAQAEYFLAYSATAVGSARENEPNDEPSHATAIAYGGRRSGTIAVEQVDWYVFSGRAGDMVRLQYFDSWNAQAADDWIDVAFYDSDGVTKLGNGGNDNLQTLTTILQHAGLFYVQIGGHGNSTEYTIQLTLFKSSAYETEPNDSLTEFDTLGPAVAGVIGSEGDVDIYRVNLKERQLVRLACYASDSYTGSDGDFNHCGHGSALAPRIEVLDDTGEVVASSTSIPLNDVYTESVTQALPTCTLAGTALVTGTYYVRISDANGSSGLDHYYVLEFQTR